MRSVKEHKISVWRPPDFEHVELHRGIGVDRDVPRHWHDEFQLCFIEDGAGELTYRGASHETPPASLFIVHPGEIHSNRSYNRSGCTYRTLMIEPELVRAVAGELSGRERGVPFFPTTMLFDRDMLVLFKRLHVALEIRTSILERESLLLEFSSNLISRFSEQRPALGSFKSKGVCVSRACDYLVEHFDQNVRLGELASLASLSPFHFSRIFSEQVGMPPHAFQTQVRIARAKAFLNRGWSLSQVATRTGFADQSHLTRHFKRLVGVTPGRYQQSSKNVQDIF